MPGMGMYLRPVLQQQLQLAQCISLQLLVRVRTDGEEDVADQLAVLEAMKADFDKGVYTSVPEFLIRVGKRIKKNTRTQGTREIVAALRAIVATCGVTDLAGVLQLIETTIAVAKRHMPPNEELSELVGVLVSEACADEAMRREVYEAWLKTATAENGILAALSTATTACTMESEVFKVFLQEVLSNSDDAHFLEAVTTHMQELTSAQPSVARIKRVMLLLKEYGRLGSHIPIHMPGYKVAAYLDKETSMEHVPLVFQPFLAELDPEVTGRIVAFMQEDVFTKSIDHQRGVLYALVLFLGTRGITGATIIANLVRVCETGSDFVRICAAAIRAAGVSPDRVGIPSDITTFADAMQYLTDHTASSAFVRLPFHDGYRAKILDALDRMHARTVTAVISLAAIYEQYHPKGLELLARIMEQLVDGTFATWRYSHELAEQQLAPVHAAKAWIKNERFIRILGRQDQRETKLAAARLLRADALHAFEELFHVPWDKGLASQDEMRLSELEGKFRANVFPNEETKKALGKEKQLLHRRYKAGRLLELFNFQESYLDLVLGILQERVREPWIGPLKQPIENALTILNSPEFAADRTVVIEETDDPTKTLHIGVDPVKSCQRWTERTGHNQCLLSYVVDAHKKEWQISTKRGALIGRAVARLFPYKKSALLLLEQPYTTVWSSEHMQALVLSVLLKAKNVTEETGKPVYVGFVGWKRASEYANAFTWAAETLHGELKSVTVPLRFLPSLNGVEYSDALGGEIQSETKTEAVALHYLVVNANGESAEDSEDE